MGLLPGFIYDSVAGFVKIPNKGYGLRLYGATGGSVGLKPPVSGSSTDFTFPNTDGAPNTFLQTNGSAVLTFASIPSANPTGTVGLTAVNGSASTFMRSDAAPALNLTISPTMTGVWTFTQPITLQSPLSVVGGGTGSSKGGFATSQAILSIIM